MKFGRCMSKQEARELRKTPELYDHGNDLIPVFDSSRTVEEKLRNMSKDQLRTYFGNIGVRSPQAVVFFDVPAALQGIVGPIPQKNGLREYKIPEGTRISEYDSIRL